jgi:hypothetical protein
LEIEVEEENVFTKDLKQLKENQILAAKLVTGLEFEQARKTILRLM